jgi:hypothetical protein
MADRESSTTRSTSVAVFGVMIALMAALTLGFASRSVAAVPSPGWAVDAIATPSSFSTEDTERCLPTIGQSEPSCDGYLINVLNVGSRPSNGTPVVIKDEIPAGLTVQQITLHWSGFPQEFGGFSFNMAELPGICTPTPAPSGTAVQCEVPPEFFGFHFPPVAPDDRIVMRISVTVDEPVTPGTVANKVLVEGGGAPTVSTQPQNAIQEPAPGFGPSSFEVGIHDVDGTPDTQAGGHPYELTTSIGLNSEFRTPPDAGGKGVTSVQDVKDVAVDLPLGFLGSALATPTCTFAQLSSHIESGVGGCPSDTIVGHIQTEPERADSVNGPIYNMVPEHGVAAEFGYVDTIAGSHVLYASVVPGAAGYVLRTIAREVPQVSLTHISVTFFGDPAARDGSGSTPVALFTNPASCSEAPLTTTAHIDSWQHPGRLTSTGEPDLGDPNWVSTSSSSPPVTGCNELRFDPSALRFQPEATTANSPTGAQFELAVPQSTDPSTLSSPPLRSATVTLPAGLIVNPASADGLAACSSEEIGWLGGSPTNFSSQPPACPASSKIGSVSVTTPLLPSTLTGSVYLAAENDNPFNSVLAGYIVINDPQTGVLVKIAGKLELDPQTGQITGVFDENPQLPFSDLKLRFFGGARGDLATPEQCGTFTTSGVLTPWSSPDSGPALQLFDAFSIGSGCGSTFSPSFTAGVTNPQAGAFSPIAVSFTRQDSEPDISGISVAMPPGLLAKLKGVALCPDAAVAAATAETGAEERSNQSCPEASKVGTVLAGAGAGPDPFFISGQVYLTGPYKGAPYGLAVIVPALAGPFDLGTVVIRQALEIDPTDAHVTDVSDPLPTILDVTGHDERTDGFPIRLRRVDVSIDRPSFGLAPTNCSTLHADANFLATNGAQSSAASRFQVGGCSGLHFKPRFSASTQAHTSKRNGASLRVKVTAGAGEANIGKARVTLPRQLPSRLETLQEACTEQVFASDPAACPAASRVGTATAVTPLLEQPLQGPAYIVSHGGAAFPDLVLVLQGNGITLDLDGTTDIKHNITTSTFNALPDAPITSFELILPAGRHSILGAVLPARARGSMCGQHLTMPTILTGQNGAKLKQQTKIAVTGCRHKSGGRSTARKHHRRHR